MFLMSSTAKSTSHPPIFLCKDCGTPMAISHRSFPAPLHCCPCRTIFYRDELCRLQSLLALSMGRSLLQPIRLGLTSDGTSLFSRWLNTWLNSLKLWAIIAMNLGQSEPNFVLSHSCVLAAKPQFLLTWLQCPHLCGTCQQHGVLQYVSGGTTLSLHNSASSIRFQATESSVLSDSQMVSALREKRFGDAVGGNELITSFLAIPVGRSLIRIQIVAEDAYASTSVSVYDFLNPVRLAAILEHPDYSKTLRSHWPHTFWQHLGSGDGGYRCWSFRISSITILSFRIFSYSQYHPVPLITKTHQILLCHTTCSEGDLCLLIRFHTAFLTRPRQASQ